MMMMVPDTTFPEWKRMRNCLEMKKTRISSIPATPQMEVALEEPGDLDTELDLDARVEVETKARGSQEFKKPPSQD